MHLAVRHETHLRSGETQTSRLRRPQEFPAVSKFHLDFANPAHSCCVPLLSQPAPLLSSVRYRTPTTNNCRGPSSALMTSGGMPLPAPGTAPSYLQAPRDDRDTDPSSPTSLLHVPAQQLPKICEAAGQGSLSRDEDISTLRILWSHKEGAHWVQGSKYGEMGVAVEADDLGQTDSVVCPSLENRFSIKSVPREDLAWVFYSGMLFRLTVAAIQGLLLVLTIAVNTIGLNHLLCNHCRPLWKCHGVTAAGAPSRWLCLSLAVLGSTAVASFNSSLRRAVRQELTLQSQSYNNCFVTGCGSGYMETFFLQATCDPGAYVYRFTVTSGTDTYQYVTVNHVNLTCSDGKYLSQGDLPTTVYSVISIMNASGFDSVKLSGGCILDHLQVNNVDTGNAAFGNLYSCSCPSGQSIIVGLPLNYYDPSYYPSFATFGIVCDNNFCSRGQYFSNGQCLSCPSGHKFA